MNEYETIKKWVNSFDEKIYYKLKPLTKKELYEIAIKQEEEIERLNNIINNLEEYSETEIKYWEKEYKFSDHYDKANILGYITALKNILNKIKELKGVDKE